MVCMLKNGFQSVDDIQILKKTQHNPIFKRLPGDVKIWYHNIYIYIYILYHSTKKHYSGKYIFHTAVLFEDSFYFVPAGYS